MRALRDRPTALERWPKGVHEGIGWPPGTATRPTRSTRSGCPRARPTTSRPRRITFPCGRTADEVCPTELAVPAWAAQMGTLTFHPWPVRRDRRRTTPTSCASTSTRSRAPTSRDAVRVAGVARELLDGPRAGRLPEDRRQPRRAHLRADRAAVDVHRRAARRDRVRPRAGAPRRPGSRRAGGRRSAASGSSSTTTRTPATGPSPRAYSPAAEARRARSRTPMDVGRAGRGRGPGGFNLLTVPERFAERGDVHAAIDDVHCDLHAAAGAVRRAGGRG